MSDDQEVVRAFQLSSDLVTRLMRVALSRDESVEECVVAMLDRGLELEEIFGPVETDACVVWEPAEPEVVDDEPELVGDYDWQDSIREDV
jgi:hypothetical protein